MLYTLKSIIECIDKKKRLVCLVCVILIVPGVLPAGIKMGINLEHPVVIKHETVNAFLTIKNDTDRLLIIDEKNAFKGTALRLDFDIYMKRYNSLPKRNGRQIVPEMNLIPGDRRVLMIDISKYYDLSKEGRYIISAVLAGKKGTLMSNKKVVDVVRGIELASVTKEVPGYEEEYRKISVRYWNRHRKEILFLTVDDEVNHTNYGVFQLGPLIRINKPVIKYDRSGRFSVTHQCRGDCFVVTSFQLAHTSVTSLNQRYLTHEGTPYTMANSSKGRLIEELKVKSKRSDKK